MTGAWRVHPGARAGAARRGAPGWSSRADGQDVVQFDGPVLELMTETRRRFDQRLARLGPDIIARGLRRARVPAAAARGRPDARRSATRCWTSARSPGSGTSGRPRAAGWPRSTRGAPTADGQRRRGAADRRASCARGCSSRARDGNQTRHRKIYNNAGPRLPALRRRRSRPRPGRRQPDDILVPGMPEMTTSSAPCRRIGHKGADHIAPGNTTASFDAALAHGCDMVEFDVLPERADDGTTPAASCSPTTSRTPRGRDAADARGGPGPPRAARPSRGIELDVDLKTPRLRGARDRGAARARHGASAR